MNMINTGCFGYVIARQVFLIWIIFLFGVPATYAQGANCNPPYAYPGDKGVYGGTLTYSHDYIDVNTLIPTGSTDVCAAIAQGLYYLNGGDTTDNKQCATPYYHTKGVIDARGVASSNGIYSCTQNPFPGTQASLSTLQTVLLPAGTIPIANTWVLPANTQLIGEGRGNGGTVLQATSGFTPANSIEPAFIYMGDGPFTSGAGGDSPLICGGHNCTGISVEHLQLDGHNATGVLDGIFNNSSQELNYVNDVQMYQLSGTGLKVVGELTNRSNPPGKADTQGHTQIFITRVAVPV